jgi:hypothetical protein
MLLLLEGTDANHEPQCFSKQQSVRSRCTPWIFVRNFSRWAALPHRELFALGITPASSTVRAARGAVALGCSLAHHKPGLHGSLQITSSSQRACNSLNSSPVSRVCTAYALRTVTLSFLVFCHAPRILILRLILVVYSVSYRFWMICPMGHITITVSIARRRGSHKF